MPAPVQDNQITIKAFKISTVMTTFYLGQNTSEKKPSTLLCLTDV